jgi:hypothetical protein
VAETAYGGLMKEKQGEKLRSNIMHDDDLETFNGSIEGGLKQERKAPVFSEK